MAKRLSKAAAKRAIKELRAKIGAVRLAWETRGLAEGEFDQVKAWEREVWEIERDAGLLPDPDQVDSLIR